jgi:isopenicillin-N epimerase
MSEKELPQCFPPCEFQEDQNWESVRCRCQTILIDLINEIESLTGLPSIYGASNENFVQIAGAEIPADCHPASLQEWLYQEYKIEVPVIDWEGRWFIRPSIHGYNSKKDIEIFLNAIKEYLGNFK